jgi:hypothetical protein
VFSLHSLGRSGLRVTAALGACAALLIVPAAGASAQSCPPNQPFCSQNPPIVNPPVAIIGHSIPLTNPGFEDTGVAAPFTFANQIQQHGWERGGAMVLGTSRHRCGTHSLSTGGNWGGNGFAYTQLTLPSDAYYPVLDLWLNVETRLPSTWGVIDTLGIYVDSGTGDMSPNSHFVGSGTWPVPIAVWSNLDASAGRFVGHEVALPTSLNGQPIRGQSIQLWLISTINSQISSFGNNFNPTTTDFYLDDLSLWTASTLFAQFC